MDLGKTVEKGNFTCRAIQSVVDTFRDGTRSHEGQKETIHLPLLRQGRVPRHSLVRVHISKQGRDFSVIVLTIHHHSDYPFVSWGDSNGVIFP